MHEHLLSGKELPREFALCLSRFTDEERDQLTRFTDEEKDRPPPFLRLDEEIEDTQVRHFEHSGENFVVRFDVPRTPATGFGDFYHPGRSRDFDRWQLQFLFLQQLERMGKQPGNFPNVLKDLRNRWEAQSAEESDQRSSENDDTTSPSHDDLVKDWAEKYNLQYPWVRRAARETVARWVLGDPPAYVLHEPSEWWYIFNEGQGHHGGLGIPVAFKNEWNPVQERREVAERRLLAQFEAAMNVQLDRAELESEESGLKRTDRPGFGSTPETLQKHLAWLAERIVLQKPVYQIALHDRADKSHVKRRINELAKKTELLPLPKTMTE